ncbi:molybdopterin-dependent oxidoreductase [Dyadobacter arcticus]|uniref:DMSO/TMAO reductase YedYZ molybdopterin-dependent catalytic subunit n=1 Tax=Dyadobacter arcticus TaxID=1078754 RepID=A0ABX0UIA6_9BACT|nr:molybdopterin-dependent oxidoreductase [Dyadobacter arcticus]NIJ52522.1 DMSO/TMAO reductase YedYZ molybdopterin-dependent catalytic subunit [Dyadobacter arcticus]
MYKPKISKRCIAVLLLFFGVTFSSLAQNTATLSIGGEVTTPLELKLSDLSSFKQVSHKVKDRDGKEHVFAGVALIELLEKAGVTTGAKLRGENLAKYLLITAADGYEVLYSLAEIDPEFTDQIILLATTKDGQPFGTGEGPFRIITPNDKKPARWIREVRSIKVAFAKN